MMSNALKLDNLDELNSHILQLQKEISDKQAILATLQHRKEQMYIEGEKVQEKRPESPLLVVHAPNKDSDNPNVDLKWVCDFVKRAPATIYRWVGAGKIPYTKCGKNLVFDRNEIKDWWGGYKVPTKEERKMEVLRKLAK